MFNHFSVRYPTNIQNGICAIHMDVDATEQQTLCLRFFGKEILQTFILGGQWCILSLGQSICDTIRQDYLHSSMLIKDF